MMKSSQKLQLQPAQNAKSKTSMAYATVASYPKKQSKPTLSTYHSIKNLHQEVKSLFEQPGSSNQQESGCATNVSENIQNEHNNFLNKKNSNKDGNSIGHIGNEYIQYMQNFTLQSSDSNNNLHQQQISEQYLQLRAYTTSPQNSIKIQQYTSDHVNDRQKATFSPNPQSMQSHLSNQISTNQQYQTNIQPMTTKNSQNKKISYFGTKAPTFKVQNSITKSQSNKNLINDKFQSQGIQLTQTQSILQPQASMSNLIGINKSQIKMIDLINSQAKKPYESKTKKSMMNESSQLLINYENMPAGMILRDIKETAKLYIQPKTAMENYRINTDAHYEKINLQQFNSQSLANSNEHPSIHQDGLGGTFCSLKDSMDYAAQDQIVKTQQDEPMHHSNEKDFKKPRRNQQSHDNNAQMQSTPIKNQFSNQTKHQRQPNSNHNFNQTTIQPQNNLFSPTSNEQSTAACTGVKNKTHKLNKMLKNLINDTNPTYSQIAQVSSPKLSPYNQSIGLNSQPSISQTLQSQTANNKQLQGANYCQKQQAITTHKKDNSQKTAIQNFKKQSKGIKVNQTINIQSNLKPNQSKGKINTTRNDGQNRKTPIEQISQPIQINLYSSDSQASFNSPGVDQVNLVMQIEGLKKEIEQMKSIKSQLQGKDREIQQLKKKIQGLSNDKVRLRHQVSAARAGGIGGQIDQSSGNATSACEITSNSKKVDRSALSSGGASRSYAKPFQQLVSHIKSRAGKNIRIENQDTINLGPSQHSPILNENLIKTLNHQKSTRNKIANQSNSGVTSNHRLLSGHQMHVQSQPLLLSQFNQHEEFSIGPDDQSPPLKLKRVISQQSIDSISNYSSSQQKRENLRYKRSKDEWDLNQEEQDSKIINEDAFESHDFDQERIRDQQQKSENKREAQQNQSIQEMSNLKDRMKGFIQNYVHYIRYLENKIRRLESNQSQSLNQ